MEAAGDLIEHPETAERQKAELARVLALFENRSAAANAADAIEEVAGLTDRASSG